VHFGGVGIIEVLEQFHFLLDFFGPLDGGLEVAADFADFWSVIFHFLIVSAASDFSRRRVSGPTAPNPAAHTNPALPTI